MGRKYRIEESTQVLGIHDGYRVYDARTGEYIGRVAGLSLGDAHAEAAKGRIYDRPYLGANST